MSRHASAQQRISSIRGTWMFSNKFILWGFDIRRSLKVEWGLGQGPSFPRPSVILYSFKCTFGRSIKCGTQVFLDTVLGIGIAAVNATEAPRVRLCSQVCAGKLASELGSAWGRLYMPNLGTRTFFFFFLTRKLDIWRRKILFNKIYLLMLYGIIIKLTMRIKY